MFVLQEDCPLHVSNILVKIFGDQIEGETPQHGGAMKNKERRKVRREKSAESVDSANIDGRLA